MDEAEGERVAFVGCMRLAVHFLPLRQIDFRKMRVRRNLGIHPSQMEIGGLLQQQTVDLAAADNA
ncbi:hypothetical protein D3C81_1476630 [compost metagenome]